MLFSQAAAPADFSGNNGRSTNENVITCIAVIGKDVYPESRRTYVNQPNCRAGSSNSFVPVSDLAHVKSPWLEFVRSAKLFPARFERRSACYPKGRH